MTNFINVSEHNMESFSNQLYSLKKKGLFNLLRILEVLALTLLDDESNAEKNTQIDASDFMDIDDCPLFSLLVKYLDLQMNLISKVTCSVKKLKSTKRRLGRIRARALHDIRKLKGKIPDLKKELLSIDDFEAYWEKAKTGTAYEMPQLIEDEGVVFDDILRIQNNFMSQNLTFKKNLNIIATTSRTMSDNEYSKDHVVYYQNHFKVCILIQENQIILDLLLKKYMKEYSSKEDGVLAHEISLSFFKRRFFKYDPSSWFIGKIMQDRNISKESRDKLLFLYF